MRCPIQIRIIRSPSEHSGELGQILVTKEAAFLDADGLGRDNRCGRICWRPSGRFGARGQGLFAQGDTVKHKKLETHLRTHSAGIPDTLLLGIEAFGFPTFWLLL